MTNELRTEVVAETACVAIVRMAGDAAERRAAAKRVAERFGLRVEESTFEALELTDAEEFVGEHVMVISC